MAKNRTCFICGNKYDYCPSCERDKMKPSWYALFCGDVCDNINDILSANTAKKITDKEASKRLKGIDFTSVKIKDNDVKRRIDELLRYKTKEEVKETSEK